MTRASKTVAEKLAAWMQRDEAYGRMLDASIARDDAAYEQAKIDFWRAK